VVIGSSESVEESAQTAAVEERAYGFCCRNTPYRIYSAGDNCSCYLASVEQEEKVTRL